jgi:hypothetical protein
MLRRSLLPPYLHPREHLTHCLKPWCESCSSIFLESWPVTVWITCSGSPASSRSVTTVWRRSWNRKPGRRGGTTPFRRENA